MMTITALLIILSIRALFGVLLYVRVGRIKKSIHQRFTAHRRLLYQQRMFDYVLVAMWLIIAILVTMIVLFVY